MTQVREISKADGFDSALWQQAGELGWLGLMVPKLWWARSEMDRPGRGSRSRRHGLCPLPFPPML